jgi:hypothetical protein
MGDLMSTGQEFLNLAAATLLRTAFSVLRRNKARIVFAGLASWLFFSPAQAVEPVLPLVLETTIPLPNVGGRIDHLAVDLVRKRLFIAEVGNNTLDAIDLATQKPVHRIAGLDEPQGVVYLPEPDLIAIGNGGDGAVRSSAGRISRLAALSRWATTPTMCAWIRGTAMSLWDMAVVGLPSSIL